MSAPSEAVGTNHNAKTTSVYSTRLVRLAYFHVAAATGAGVVEFSAREEVLDGRVAVRTPHTLMRCVANNAALEVSNGDSDPRCFALVAGDGGRSARIGRGG